MPGRPSPEVLAWAWEQFGSQAAIGTSYQGAGLVMMHLAKTAGLTFPVFTLDTGLLFPETLALKRRLEDFYGLKIEAIEPDLTVEQQADVHGAGIVETRPGPLLHRAQSPALARQIGGAGLLAHRPAAASNRPRGRRSRSLNFISWMKKPAGKSSRSIPWPNGRGSKYGRTYENTKYLTIRCTIRATAPLAACPARARPRTAQDERAGRWTGFKKVECGIHTFLPKKVDFQI